MPKTSGIFSELLISDPKTGTQTRRHASNHQQCCIQGKGPCNRHSGTIFIRNPATSAFCFRSSIITNPMNTIDLMILHCATVFSKQCGSRVSSPQTLSHQKSIAINYMAIKLSGNFQVSKSLSIVGNFSVLLTSLRTFSGSSLLMCRLPSKPQYFKLSNRDCFQPSNAWRPSTCRSPFTRNLEDFNEKYKYHATFPNRAAGNLRDCDRLYRVQGRHLNTRRTSSKFSVPRSGIDRSCHQRNNQCNLQRTSRF